MTARLSKKIAALDPVAHPRCLVYYAQEAIAMALVAYRFFAREQRKIGTLASHALSAQDSYNEKEGEFPPERSPHDPSSVLARITVGDSHSQLRPSNHGGSRRSLRSNGRSLGSPTHRPEPG